MNKRLFIVFLLGFSSGLPLALLTGPLQAWFSDAGLSLMTVGLLSMIGLPHSYRFLWAPCLDRYTLFSLGRRRSWMLAMQILILLGFNAMAWFTPQFSPGILVFLAALLAFFSATLDIAIDAHRTEYLLIHEKALGASLAVLGYRLALLIAGGFTLVIAQHLGWPFAYRLMGSFMLIGIIVTLCASEPVLQETSGDIQSIGFLRAFMEPSRALFSRPGILLLLLFIVLYKLAEAFTSSTSGVVMPFLIQGLGFSLETIGYVNKVMGVVSAICGGLMAGILLMRWSLYRALMTFGLLQSLSGLLFVALALVGQHLGLFCTAVICENFSAGMSSVALVTLFMRLVDQRFTATQFSILIACSTLPRIFSGPLAALGQSWLGWSGLYELSFLCSLGFVPLLILVSQTRSTPVSNGERSHIQNVLHMKQSKEI